MRQLEVWLASLAPSPCLCSAHLLGSCAENAARGLVLEQLPGQPELLRLLRRSPPRPRYRCDSPKWPPGADAVRGVPSLAKRYTDLYVPSDVARVTAAWQHSAADALRLPLTHHVALKVLEVWLCTFLLVPALCALSFGKVPVKVACMLRFTACMCRWQRVNLVLTASSCVR